MTKPSRDAQAQGTPRCPPRYAAYIDKLLAGDLSRRKMSKLRNHLAGCEGCQARYNRVVLASRLLQGGPEALELPAQRELDWIETAVLDRARLVPDNAPARRSMLRRFAVPAITVAALLAVGLPMVLRSTPPRAPTAPRGDLPLASAPSRALPQIKQAHAPGGSFAPRGSEDKMSTKVGLRAFCIHRETADAPASITGIVPASATTPLAGCQLQEVMRFAYTNRSPLGYLFLLGLDQAYEIKWYAPHPPQRSSIVVARDVVDRPLNRAVRLKVNHSEGLVRLFAVFSEQPLQAAQIQKAVREVRAAKTPLAKLQVLPLEQTEQRSLLVMLAP